MRLRPVQLPVKFLGSRVQVLWRCRSERYVSRRCHPERSVRLDFRTRAARGGRTRSRRICVSTYGSHSGRNRRSLGFARDDRLEGECFGVTDHSDATFREGHYSKAKSEKRKAKSEKRKAKSEKRKAKSEKRKAKSEKRKAAFLLPFQPQFLRHGLHRLNAKPDVLVQIDAQVGGPVDDVFPPDRAREGFVLHPPAY